MIDEKRQLNAFKEQVTILLPAFNAEQTITRAIKSVLAQTWPRWKLLIVNDGSEDATAEVAHRFLGDKRISMVSNRKNAGLVYSLNRGLDLINTRWVARFDADDIMLPRRLELQLTAIQRDFPAVCGGGIIQNGKLKKLVVKSDSQIKSALDFLNPIHHPTVILDMNQLGSMRYPNEKCEDYCFWVNLAKEGKTFENIAEPTIVYTVSPGQKSFREKHEIPEICSVYASSKTSIESQGKHHRLERIKHTFSESPFKNLIMEFMRELNDPIYIDRDIRNLYRARLVKSLVKKILKKTDG